MKKIEFIKMHIYILVYIFIYPKREPKIPFFLVVVIGLLVVVVGRRVVVAELNKNKKINYQIGISNSRQILLMSKLEEKHKNGGKWCFSTLK